MLQNFYTDKVFTDRFTFICQEAAMLCVEVINLWLLSTFRLQMVYFLCILFINQDTIVASIAFIMSNAK